MVIGIDILCLFCSCVGSTANIILYSTLTGLGVIGVLTFILIRRNKKDDRANEEVNLEVMSLKLFVGIGKLLLGNVVKSSQIDLRVDRISNLMLGDIFVFIFILT